MVHYSVFGRRSGTTRSWPRWFVIVGGLAWLGGGGVCLGLLQRSPKRRCGSPAGTCTSGSLFGTRSEEFTGLGDAFDEMRARLEAAFIPHARHLGGRRPASGDFRLRDTAIRTSLAAPWSLPACRRCHYADSRFGSRPGLFHSKVVIQPDTWGYPGAVQPRACPDRRKACSGSSRRKDVCHSRFTPAGPAPGQDPTATSTSVAVAGHVIGFQADHVPSMTGSSPSWWFQAPAGQPGIQRVPIADCGRHPDRWPG